MNYKPIDIFVRFNVIEDGKYVVTHAKILTMIQLCYFIITSREFDYQAESRKP